MYDNRNDYPPDYPGLSGIIDALSSGQCSPTNQSAACNELQAALRLWEIKTWCGEAQFGTVLDSTGSSPPCQIPRVGPFALWAVVWDQTFPEDKLYILDVEQGKNLGVSKK